MLRSYFAIYYRKRSLVCLECNIYISFVNFFSSFLHLSHALCVTSVRVCAYRFVSWLVNVVVLLIDGPARAEAMTRSAYGTDAVGERRVGRAKPMVVAARHGASSTSGYVSDADSKIHTLFLRLVRCFFLSSFFSSLFGRLPTDLFYLFFSFFDTLFI